MDVRLLLRAGILFSRPWLAQVPAEESVAQVMGWLRRTFGRQGIDVPEPLEVLLASCCLLDTTLTEHVEFCDVEEFGVVVLFTGHASDLPMFMCRILPEDVLIS